MKSNRFSGPQLVRAAVQVVGFALSIAALIWCYRLATGNQQLAANWSKLGTLPLWLMLALPLLSACTVVLSGLVFWTVIRPVQALPLLPTVAVNGVCTLLGYLPFKLSLFFRVLWHNRRDGVALPTIGGWFGAVASVILVSLAAPVLAALLVPAVAKSTGLQSGGSAIFFIAMAVMFLVVGIALLYPLSGVASLLSGKLFGPVEERASVHASIWGKVAAILAKLADGLVMLHNPRVLLAAGLLRGLDLAAQGLRFTLAGYAAAHIGLLTAPLEVSQAVIAGCLYFLLQLLAPTGVAGAREGGTVAIFAMLSPGLNAEQIAPVVLVVSAAELVGNVFVGVPSIVVLMLRKRQLTAEEGKMNTATDWAGGGA